MISFTSIRGLRYTRQIFLLVWGMAWCAGAQKGEIRRFSFTAQPLLSGSDTAIAHTPTALGSFDEADTLGPARVIIRKRLGMDSYALFVATINPQAFSRGQLRWFPLPRGSTWREVLGIKLFSQEKASPDQDMRIVLFDKHRIYADAATLWYSSDSSAESVLGCSELLRGSFVCSSSPASALVIIQGKNSGRKTPCEISDLFPGRYEIEVWHPDYRFGAKSVDIHQDSVAFVSFSLVSDMDTVYVHGRQGHGLLILPRPPLNTPFRLDGDTTREQEIMVPAGQHKIEWSRGPAFETLDSTINIRAGRALFFFFLPRPREGLVRITRAPKHLSLTINDRTIPEEDTVVSLGAGSYTFRGETPGFHTASGRIFVQPDSLSLLEVLLDPVRDRDRDGFADSLDRCPDIYGLFSGCPSPGIKSALASKSAEVLDSMRLDPLGIGVVMFGFINRTPLNGRFRRILSNFDDGKHALDNRRGLTIGNTVTAHYKGVFGALELGQWLSGLECRREDTVTIRGRDGDYLVLYDSAAGIFPVIYLPSTAVSAGFHFGVQWFNISYAVGYQWEDIVIRDLIAPTGDVIVARFDNDFWFHHLCADVQYRVQGLVAPSVFGSMKVPFGGGGITLWNSMSVGLQIRFFPFHNRPRTMRGSEGW